MIHGSRMLKVENERGPERLCPGPPLRELGATGTTLEQGPREEGRADGDHEEGRIVLPERLDVGISAGDFRGQGSDDVEHVLFSGCC